MVNLFSPSKKIVSIVKDQQYLFVSLCELWSFPSIFIHINAFKNLQISLHFEY